MHKQIESEDLCAQRELGQPLPNSRHAVSVSLPKWEHVVGYEEKKPEVMARLASGYPRFVVHPLVSELAKRFGNGACLPFPSRRSAELAAAFVQRTTGQPAEIVSADGVCVVSTAAGGSIALKSFWQHTGLIVSSRQAEAALEGRAADHSERELARQALKRQLAGFYDCDESDLFLGPTGMAAIYAALQTLLQRTPQCPTAQLGFPYVDTLKVQEKFGHRAILLHRLSNLEERLQHLLARERLAGCFCEIPGNPLLGSADLRQISPLLRRHGVPLVADDVVATPVNIDLTNYADLIATSLTKFIVGNGEAMGGALICNPRSPFYTQLKPLIAANHEELLWGEDAAVIEAQARSFPERMQRHNRAGLLIAERLRQHPAVSQVWYPKWESGEAYEAVRRPSGGWGALITFLPHDANARSPRIYDQLGFCKGPSLGTSFTLACPFTLLAHYTELEWAETCGVSRYLLRLSVGLEDPEWIWAQLEEALNQSGRSA